MENESRHGCVWPLAGQPLSSLRLHRRNEYNVGACMAKSQNNPADTFCEMHMQTCARELTIVYRGDRGDRGDRDWRLHTVETVVDNPYM